MNWYVEHNGVSNGPHTEPEMMGRVRSNELHADTLIWHPGLEEWQEASQLKPEWFKPVTVEQPKAAPPLQRPATRPLAPTKAQEEPQKAGFLKRLFGRK